MDAQRRDQLIRALHEEFLASAQEALKYGNAWRSRSYRLRLVHGDDTHQLYMAKRDDLRLKEYLSSYNWHKDNASFCATAIGLLRDRDLNSHMKELLDGQ